MVLQATTTFGALCRGHLQVILIAVAAVGCGGGGSSPTSPVSASVRQVDISAQSGGDGHFLALGQTRQLQARVHYSDGTQRIFTSGVTWTSLHTNVATISSSGLVTAVGAGNVVVRATHQGVTSLANWHTDVRVTPAIAGSWSGTYSGLVQAGVAGFMDWTLTQSGSSVSGTVLAPDDLHHGRVTGTVQATFRPYPNERTLDFSITVPRGSMSRNLSCSMQIVGTMSVDPQPAKLGAPYLGNWCDEPPGVGFAWFNGTLSLNKQ